MKIFIGLLLVLAGCSKKGQDEKTQEDDMTTIQGTWKVKTGSFIIPDNSTVIIKGNKVVNAFVFTLKQDQSPKQIDCEFPPKDEILEKTIKFGIYELQGDELKICLGPVGRRPDKFETDPKDNQNLILHRVKKAN